MEDRKTLRSLAESLRDVLTSAGMPERAAWGCFIRLAAARLLETKPGPTQADAVKAIQRCGQVLHEMGPLPRSLTKYVRTAAVSNAWDILSGEGDRPRIDAALADATSLGWLHQYWMNADKTRVSTKMRRKAGDTIADDDLIAATCVYTSREHVRFLLQNSIGRVWAAPRDAQSWEYLVGDAGSSSRSVRDITIFDPACGAGHFLVEAMEMLFAMYRVEEPGRSAATICEAILCHNLFGLDIDERAVRIARTALALKCRELGGTSTQDVNVECAPRAGLGALHRPAGSGRSRADKLLVKSYSVVAMNPPFVGFRKLAPHMKVQIAARDPLAASDLAVAFLSRGFELLEEGGILAAVTPAAWLTSSPALALRKHMLDHGGPRVIASLGQRVFETAPLLFVSLSVVGRGTRDGGVTMVSATAQAGLSNAVKRATLVPLSRLRADPAHSFSPSAAVLPVDRAGRFAMTGDFFTFADGVWTGDNARDTRAWADVSREDPEWYPASGGHGYCRWYAPVVRVLRASAALHWPHLDRRPGCLEYSRVAGGKLAARMVFGRSAAIAGIVSMFLKDRVEDRRVDVLAVFNTRAGTLWLRALTSGLNFNSGYAARVPIPADGFSERVKELVMEAVELKRQGKSGGLAVLESKVDREVAKALGLNMRVLSDIRLPAG